jgi:hypothetical protein
MFILQMPPCHAPGIAALVRLSTHATRVLLKARWEQPAGECMVLFGIRHGGVHDEELVDVEA